MMSSGYYSWQMNNHNVLLDQGDRFGGALDGAAKQFTGAYDAGQIPMDFVNTMRKKGQLIMGIGHRVKSINNPDMRVTLVKDFVKANFPSTPLLDYALDVEKITTSKKPNLILNVDGCIAVSFVDLLRNSGCFTKDEADQFVETGSLNGLFVLGRSIGFIGQAQGELDCVLFFDHFPVSLINSLIFQATTWTRRD